MIFRKTFELIIYVMNMNIGMLEKTPLTSNAPSSTGTVRPGGTAIQPTATAGPATGQNRSGCC